MKTWLKILKYLIPKDYILVQRRPSRESLLSMALRNDHSFGLSGGMSDDEIDKIRAESIGVFGKISSNQYLKSSEKEVVLGSMRQLYEEATGQGFYKNKL